jgi:hypothetical protein
VQRQPSLDRLVVVVRAQDARGARRAMQTHGAVDLMRHDEFLPGNHMGRRCGVQQRASTLSQVCMRGEEGLDPACTGSAESVDVDPPTSASRYSKREVGQGLDAGLAQHCGDAGREPEVDAVADQGNRDGCASELLDGGSHGAGGRGAFAGRSGEELGQVVPVARPGEGRDFTTDGPDDAARRLAGRPSFSEVPRHRIPRRQTIVPGPKCSKRSRVRQRQRRCGYRQGNFHAV